MSGRARTLPTRPWLVLAALSLAAGAAALAMGSAVVAHWRATVAVSLLLGTAAVVAGWIRELHRETALRAARAAQREAAIWSEANDGILIHDDDLRVLDANARACELYGRPVEELRGTRMPDLLAPECHESLVAGFAALRATGTLRADAVHRKADGSTFPVEVNVRRVPGEHGRPVSVAVVRDMTARRREEELLRHHAALLDQMHDAVIALDRDQRIEVWNRAAEALFGTPAREAVGRPWAEVVRPVRMEPAEEELAAALDRDGTASWRATVLHRDGHEVDTEGTTVALAGGAGGVAGSLSTFHARGEAEQLRRRLAAADRMASIGTLAAGVAHEINNPLAYVLTNLGFVAEALVARGAAEDAEILSAVREGEDGARRIAAIVGALRTFSRQPATAARRQPIDPRVAARAAARMVGAQAKARAQLTLDLGEVPPVIAEEHELAQVILNLLVNAAQALPEGRAQVHEIALRLRAAGGQVEIEVHDTGPGIPPEIRARIFEPFFTTKPVGVGTGLGLAVCHGIVESLGGRIDVTSTPGQGTTFTVRLPAARGDAVQRPEVPPAPSTPRARILVLDDEPLVATAVARALAREHDVVATTDPHEALAHVLAGDRIDLFLCDLIMPEASGMECHAEVRRMRPELAAHMIFLTGGAYTADARAFLRTVPNRTIEKPFDPAALRAAVAEELRNLAAGGPARAS